MCSLPCLLHSCPLHPQLHKTTLTSFFCVFLKLLYHFIPMRCRWFLLLCFCEKKPFGVGYPASLESTFSPLSLEHKHIKSNNRFFSKYMSVLSVDNASRGKLDEDAVKRKNMTQGEHKRKNVFDQMRKKKINLTEMLFGVRSHGVTASKRKNQSHTESLGEKIKIIPLLGLKVLGVIMTIDISVKRCSRFF